MIGIIRHNFIIIEVFIIVDDDVMYMELIDSHELVSLKC